MNKKVWKLAAYGAIAAVVVDYFIDPSLKKTLRLR